MSYGSTWAVDPRNLGGNAMPMDKAMMDQTDDRMADSKYMMAGKMGYKAYDNPMDMEHQMMYHEMAMRMMMNPMVMIYDVKYGMMDGEHETVTVIFKNMKENESNYDYSGMSMMKSKMRSMTMTGM